MLLTQVMRINITSLDSLVQNHIKGESLSKQGDSTFNTEEFIRKTYESLKKKINVEEKSDGMPKLKMKEKEMIYTCKTK